MQRRFRQVDVFARGPYTGNPLAVVVDADGLATDAMQRFARWTNLSETAFLLAPRDPGADYRVRIFTPAAELPFAGHPTLGACHVWQAVTGHGAAVIRQESGSGLVEVRRTATGWAFAEPPLLRAGEVDEADVARVAAALGIPRAAVLDAQWVDNGPGWLGILLRDAAAVRALRPGRVDVDVGVVGPCSPGSEEAFEVRAFFPIHGGSAEDPVTGSLNASLAGWLIRTGRATAPYAVRQTTGRVTVEQDADGRIWTGGAVRAGIAGTVAL